MYKFNAIKEKPQLFNRLIFLCFNCLFLGYKIRSFSKFPVYPSFIPVRILNLLFRSIVGLICLSIHL